jgi:type IV pilus assembly protein PilV
MTPPARPASRSAGFSLVEVMVALVVCSIGLLGLAKMESLALASTSVAGTRSLVALEAESLAARMHANPGYWAAGLALAVTTIQGANGTLTFSNASLPTSTASCTTPGASSCTPPTMAAYDLVQFGNALTHVVPYYFTTITCSTTGLPVTCTIAIQWSETAVAINQQQTAAQGGDIDSLTSSNAPTYTLFVQP